MKNRLIPFVLVLLTFFVSCSETDPGISEEEVKADVIESLQENTIIFDSAFIAFENFLKTKDMVFLSDTYGNATSFAQSFDEDLARIFNHALFVNTSELYIDGDLESIEYESQKLYLHAAKGEHQSSLPKYRAQIQVELDGNPEKVVKLFTSCDCPGVERSETLNMNFMEIKYGAVKKHILPFFDMLMANASESDIEEKIQEVIETEDGKHLEPAIRLLLSGVHRIQRHPGGINAMLLDGSVKFVRSAAFLAAVEYVMSDSHDHATVQRSSITTLQVTFNSAARIALLDIWNHYN